MNGRFEIREVERGGPMELVGYAATFGQPYEVTGFTETIRRGAFKRTLADAPDVSLLVNHTGTPLARTTSGTMTLHEDGSGLRFVAQLEPSDPDVQSIVPKMKRGDLNECSFAFRATKQEWSSDKTERTLREVNIHRGDVSLVTSAANPNAMAGLRAQDLTLEQRERIAERVGNRVCGPYAGLDLGPITVTRGRSHIAVPRTVSSNVEWAKGRRAKLRSRPLPASRAHPGSGANVDGEAEPARYTDAEVQKLGEEGKAHKRLKGGGYHFPIADRRDLLIAIKAFGRALVSERASVKAFIKTRATVMGLDHELPAAWQSKAKGKPRTPERGRARAAEPDDDTDHCPACEGSGQCPECEGSGVMATESVGSVGGQQQ